MSDSQAFESEKLRGDQQTLLPAHQAVPGQFCCQGCVLRADRKAKARRSRRRAVHFLAIFAITCWVGLHFFGGVAFWKSGNHNGRLNDDGPVDFPIPSDIHLGECAYWEDAPSRWSRFRSKTSFELPLSSDKLFLLSRGIIAGDVKVEATDDDSDVATVTVIADYRDENGLDWIKVCEVEKGEKEKGVGLFGPHHIHHPYHGAHLGITVSLPRGGADKVLNVKNFETDLSIFSHHIGDLVGKVTFDNITLRSANAPIGVDSLVAQYADVASANAAIEGHFDVTDELRLHTANAPIKVQANLYNAAEGKTTTLDMSTSNGPIKSELNLYSTDENAGGDFVVRANTAMGPLDLIFQSAPVDSALSVHASTALGPATVKLHKTYEGTFEASTSLKRPTVVANRDAEDPAGKGRKRDVKISQSGNTVKGVTSWSDEGKERGSVEVSTSLAAVTLVL